jgi:hypothetical protein
VKVLRPLIGVLGALASFAALGLDSPALNPSPLNSPTQDFAADVVRRDSQGGSAVTVGRLYAAHGKVRIEVMDLPGGFFLIDHTSSALLVRPGQRIYMNARQSSPLTQIFVPVDAADPCPQWRAALEDAGAGKQTDHWLCERLGDSVFGVGAEDRTTDGPAIERRFLNPQLRFPVKILGADGVSLTLEHIQVAPQAAGLFSVPSDYHLLDPHALVERIKHSDVWAGPADP